MGTSLAPFILVRSVRHGWIAVVEERLIVDCGRRYPNDAAADDGASDSGKLAVCQYGTHLIVTATVAVRRWPVSPPFSVLLIL